MASKGNPRPRSAGRDAESDMYSVQENTSGGSNVPAFLMKLWTLVEDPSTDEIICWDVSGKTFHIFDQSRFAHEVLPFYFKHNNISSFIRQLNMYGFRKQTHPDQGGLKVERDDLEFGHTYFQRGQEQLLDMIKRKAAPVKVESRTAHVITDEMSKVLTDVTQLRGKQENINSCLEQLKRENEALWREVASLRQKHAKQQQIVTKLIQFLLSIVGRHRGVPGLKRKMPLMISNNPANVDTGTSGTSPTKAPRLVSDASIDHSYSVESPGEFPDTQVHPSASSLVIHELVDPFDAGDNNQTLNAASQVTASESASVALSPAASSPVQTVPVPQQPISQANLIDQALASANIIPESVVATGTPVSLTVTQPHPQVSLLLPSAQQPSAQSLQQQVLLQQQQQQQSSPQKLQRPVAQKGVTLPTSQQSVLLPASQQSFLLPASQQSGLLPTSQQSGLLPTSQQSGLLPTSQQSGLLPTSQQSGLLPTSQQSGLLPASQQSGLLSAAQQSGLLPPSQQSGLLSASQQSGLLPASQQKQQQQQEKQRQGLPVTSKGKLPSNQVALRTSDKPLSSTSQPVPSPKEVTEQLDLLQSDLDNLKEVLSSGQYNLDPNFLMGLFDPELSLPINVDSTFLESLAADTGDTGDTGNSSETPASGNVTGNEVLQYQPPDNLPDLFDLGLINSPPQGEEEEDLPVFFTGKEGGLQTPKVATSKPELNPRVTSSNLNIHADDLD